MQHVQNSAASFRLHHSAFIRAVRRRVLAVPIPPSLPGIMGLLRRSPIGHIRQSIVRQHKEGYSRREIAEKGRLLATSDTTTTGVGALALQPLSRTHLSVNAYRGRARVLVVLHAAAWMFRGVQPGLRCRRTASAPAMSPVAIRARLEGSGVAAAEGIREPLVTGSTIS